MPVLGTLAAASAEGFGFSRPFSPLDLFIGGAVGAWYDPGDISTLFQDSARTTAVTTLGQPVGSILDKSGRGNHLIQATSASRPTWEARVNLLERTEELNNAAWAKTDASITTNATTAPDGTTTADKVVVNTNSVVTRHEVAQGFSGATGVVFQFAFYAKKSEITKVIGQLGGTAIAAEIEFDLNAGTSTQVYVNNVANVAHSITALSDNWYLCKLEASSTSTNAMNRASVFHDSIGNGTNGWFLWGCDVRLASEKQYAYQKVVSATDYSDVAAPRYLRFDGTDDSMGTAATLNLTSTSAITVSAGLMHTNNTTAGIFLETSTNYAVNVGAFISYVTDGAGAYNFATSAAAGSEYVNTSAQSIRTPRVFSGRVNFTAATRLTRIIPRINGTTNQAVDGGSGTMSGSFGNFTLFVGRRNNTSTPFNGRMYQIILYGADSSGNTLNNLERWTAGRTGVSW